MAKSTEQYLVTQFHERFGRPIGMLPGDFFDVERIRRLHAALVLEEACEFVEACGFSPTQLMLDMAAVLAAQRASPFRTGPQNASTILADGEPNFPEAIDALCDLSYVVNGGAVTFGVELLPVFKVVHQANMAKTEGSESGLGKILKPPGWKPPDIASELKRQLGGHTLPDGTLGTAGWKP